MDNNPQPVVLELAPLPREKIGPFLLLGVEKDADKEQIEAQWAQRVIWARKNQLRVPLESINWAREVLNDPERRVRADAASFNADTLDRVLRRLEQRYAGGADAPPWWHGRDTEKPLADYVPPAKVPDLEEVRAAVARPEVPPEVPALAGYLELLVREPPDPWNLELPPEPHQDSAV
jgi:hypothetical protein